MHHCPDCHAPCHCNGDIDDIDFGEDSEGADNCIHSLSEDCDANCSDDDFYDPNEGDD